MVAVRRRKVASTRGARGPRGPRGRQGQRGEQGASGNSNNGQVAKVAEQMQRIVDELAVQLKRIAQIQVQLDRLSGVRTPQTTSLPKRPDGERKTG